MNIGVWAIDNYVVKKQYSYYYYNYTPFSTSIDSVAYTSVQGMFGGDDPNDTLGVVMSLVYGWVLWKLALVVYVF